MPRKRKVNEDNEEGENKSTTMKWNALTAAEWKEAQKYEEELWQRNSNYFALLVQKDTIRTTADVHHAEESFRKKKNERAVRAKQRHHTVMNNLEFSRNLTQQVVNNSNDVRKVFILSKIISNSTNERKEKATKLFDVLCDKFLDDIELEMQKEATPTERPLLAEKNLQEEIQEEEEKGKEEFGEENQDAGDLLEHQAFEIDNKFQELEKEPLFLKDNYVNAIQK